ncbi:MAG: hypothetical protein LBL18_02725, partial [Bacteroidales bacterium]|nr:hypothetical protein [Bacteroidales bacterium]
MKTFISLFSALLFLLLLFSLFKNISYPLLWNDESMTAYGAEVVLEYGYPKVHGERNVFYDLLHTNPTIGINEKDDAFVGSSSWGQYYYSIIGHKLAEQTDDLYTKTGILRSTYAIAGLLGMLFLAFIAMRFLPGALSRNAFVALFLLVSLISISQTLHLREVRYYALALLLSSIIIGLYIWFRFYKPFNKIVFILLETAALWLAFVTWSPLFAVALFSMGVSELVIFVDRYKKDAFAGALQHAWPALVLAIVATVSIIPMMVEFKYFELSSAIAEFTGYSAKIYWDNISVLFDHFKKQELLFVAIAMKIFLLCYVKKIRIQNPTLFKVSCFLTLYFLISYFITARIPHDASGRYIIYLQPALSVIIIFDLFMVLYNARNKQQHTLKNSKKNATVAVNKNYITPKMAFPLIVFALLFSYTLFNNMHKIKGHVYEMFHQYKGPLDYTIPYIKENFPRADTLVIAANYEEYSYMYYLGSKVIVGYVGNNLEEDAKLVPDIVAYRKMWPHFAGLFNHYFSKARYEPVSFPIFDNPVNNSPGFDNAQYPLFNHRFKTFHTENPRQA